MEDGGPGDHRLGGSGDPRRTGGSEASDKNGLQHLPHRSRGDFGTFLMILTSPYEFGILAEENRKSKE